MLEVKKRMRWEAERVRAGDWESGWSRELWPHASSDNLGRFPQLSSEVY